MKHANFIYHRLLANVVKANQFLKRTSIEARHSPVFCQTPGPGP